MVCTIFVLENGLVPPEGRTTEGPGAQDESDCGEYRV